MKRPPRDPKESLLPLRFIGLIVWQGLLLSLVTLLAFSTADRSGLCAYLAASITHCTTHHRRMGSDRSLLFDAVGCG